MPDPSRVWSALFASTLLAAGTASGQPGRLLLDIKPGPAEERPRHGPTQLTSFGDKVAFVVNEPPSASTVWVTNALDGRTSLLGAFCDDYCPEPPLILASTGSRVFFAGERKGNDRSFWASDGTLAGTLPTLDQEGVQPLIEGRSSVAAVGPGVVFLARHQDGSLHLWATNGSPGGTSKIRRVGSDQEGPALFGFMASEGHAFFGIVKGSPLELRIWSTDGTSAGTRGSPAVPVTGWSLQAAAATSTHAFVRIATASGEELLASDGTAAGTAVVTAFPGPSPFSSTVWLKPVDNRLYFVADDSAHGNELWRSDGTRQGTVRVTDFANQDAFASTATPDQVGESNGRVVFYASEGATGTTLWTSNGSPSSTNALATTCIESCSFYAKPTLHAIGDRLFFLSHLDSGPSLWATDGTVAGTQQVIRLCSDCGARLPPPALVGEQLYLLPSRPGLGRQLWSSDGTAEGTRPITRFASREAVLPHWATAGPPTLVAAGGRIWFAANEPPHGPALWSSAGAPESSQLAAELMSGGASSEPSDLVSLGASVLFSACDADNRQIWTTSGSAASTTVLRELTIPCYIPLDDVSVSGQRAFLWDVDWYDLGSRLVVTDGTLTGTTELLSLVDGETASDLLPVPGGIAFFLQTFDDPAPSLWRSDGTPSGTARRVTLPTGLELPRYEAALGSDVYFVTSEEYSTPQVWRIDLVSGTALTLTAFAEESHRLASTPNFSAFGGRVYFRVGGDAGGQIWASDGSAAGTRLAVELPPAAGRVHDLATDGNSLLVHSAPSAESYQLWRSDGTQQGTVLLASFHSGGSYDLPRLELARVAGRTYFVGNDVNHGKELWSTDGTPAGTKLVRDVNPGRSGASPAELTPSGQDLYFVATDPRHGRELWMVRGGTEGAHLAHDINPEASSSSPSELAATASNLFFVADDGLFGREPWLLAGDGSAGCQATATSLCLAEDRFLVEATWSTVDGGAGVGYASQRTSDTGTFWFFSPTNVEVIVKVLDGQAINGHHWVFYGALSNVEYTLTVTDTASGAVRRYNNPPGRQASVGDTEAFGPRGASAVLAASYVPIPRAAAPASTLSSLAAKVACTPSATRLCLAGGRFAVEVSWRDFAGGEGDGAAHSLSNDSGDFWFFSPSNIELLVKILDGRAVNGKFWVFYGALSSVEYTLTVTDTETGVTRTYFNPSGRLASVADTSAF